jgi:hypothetical protein
MIGDKIDTFIHFEALEKDRDQERKERTMQGGIKAACGPVWAVERGSMQTTNARITRRGDREVVVEDILVRVCRPSMDR